MKKCIKFIIFLLLVLCGCNSFAQSVGEILFDEGCFFEITSLSPRRMSIIHPPAGDPTFVHYDGVVIVPDTIYYTPTQPFQVNAVADSAFFGCSTVTKVELPATIQTIGLNAFSGTSNLDTLRCWGEIPPTMFYDNITSMTSMGNIMPGADYNRWRNTIVLRAPCSGIDNYITATGWSIFLNVTGENMYMIYKDTICDDESYYKHQYSLAHPASGIYELHNLSGGVTGCTYDCELRLVVRPTYYNVFSYYYCDPTSLSYNEKGFHITNWPYGANTWYNNDVSIHGCDSISRLDFRAMVNEKEFFDSICPHTSTLLTFEGIYTFNIFSFETAVPDTDIVIQKNFAPSGNITTSYQEGCSTTVTANIHISHIANDTLEVDRCQGFPYTWTRNGYNASRVSVSHTDTYSTSGFHSDTLFSNMGCLMYKNLDLHVWTPSDTVIFDTICGTECVLFGTNHISTEGVHTAIYPNAHLCDSTVALHLTVYNSYTDQAVTTSSVPIYHTDFNQDETRYSWSFDNGTNGWRIRNGYLRVSSGDNTNNYNTSIASDSYAYITFNTGDYDYIRIDMPLQVGGETRNDYLRVITPNATQSAQQYYNTTTNYSSTYANSRHNQVDTLKLYWHNNANGRGTQTAVQINELTITGISNQTRNHPVTQITAHICQGESYTYGSDTYSTTGSYPHSYATAVHGCDSNTNLSLTVHQPSLFTHTTDFCNGDSISFDGIFYKNTILKTNNYTDVWGCDSIRQLDLTVWPTPTDTLNITHLGDNPYIYDGHPITQSGTYTFHYPTVHGCDSTVILNIAIHPNSYHTINAEICDNQVYDDNGFLVSAQGVYRDTLHNVYGADSIVTLNLIVHPTYDINLYEEICQGETFVFNSHSLTTTGSTTDELVSRYGCDSIVTMNLTVHPVYSTTLDTTIYGDDPFLFQGLTITESGTYYKHYASQYGCDSLFTLNIIIHNNADTVIRAAICDGDLYTENGFSEGVAGNYVHHTATAAGADSTITLILTVHPVFDDTLSVAICERTSYSFGGSQYNSVGCYTDSLHSVHGCDSISTLCLAVNPVSDDVIYDTVRGDQGYDFYGHHYAATGIFKDTLPNRYGCDSITELHLQIYPTKTEHIYDTICNTQVYNNYDFVGLTATNTYTRTGLYTVVGHSDSTAILHLWVNPVYDDTIPATICDRTSYTFGGNGYTATGYYTDSLLTYRGCDSVQTLLLTVNPVFDTIVFDTVRGDTGYDFYGVHYDSTGIYRDTLPNIYGCDSITELHLQIYPSKTEHIYDTICQGQIYNSHDFLALVTSGTYIRDHLFTTVGHSDSTAYLHLWVNPVYDDTIPAVICDRTTYLFGGNSYTTTGLFTDSLLTYRGCDSVVTLSLLANPVFDTIIFDTVRGDTGYSFYGELYTETGVYRDTLPNIYGCDSITELHLQIYPSKTEHIYDTICATQVYNGHDFMNVTEAGTHMRSGLFTVVGHSDSTAYLHLWVNPIYDDTTAVTICDRTFHSFGGNDYGVTGYYTDSLHTYRGCDSVQTLWLTVNPVFDSIVYDTVRGDQGYDFYGLHYDSTGVYRDTLPNIYGCDSITELHLQIYNTKTQHIYDTICHTQTYTQYQFNESTTGIFYRTGLYTVVGQADSTAVLHLHVNPIYQDTLVQHICDRTTFSEFGNHVLSTTGYTTDSLLTFRGCDSVMTMHLIVDSVYEVAVFDTVRGDNGYDFLGLHLDSTGIYCDTLPTIMGCDSIIHLNLKIYNTATTHLYDTICQTQVYSGYDFSGQTTAGTYQRDLLTSGGADSTVYLHLWVNPIYDDTLVQHICDRTTYSGFGNHVLSTTGYTTDSLLTYRMCDSIVTMHLIVDPVFEMDVYDTLRGDEPYNFLGTLIEQTGIYCDTLPTILGCDSIIHMNLQIYKNAYTSLYDTICDRNVYDGFGFSGLTEAGTYVDSLYTYGGADSVITMHLWVNPVFEVEVYDTICSNTFLLHHGDTLTAAGSYTDTLPSIHGCDSIITLHLFVKPAYDDTSYAEICNGEHFHFHFNEPLTEAGMYRYYMQAHNGCDSIETLMLTVHPTYNYTIQDSILPTENYMFGNHIIYEPGFYSDTLTSQFGCDSIIHLELQHWYLHTTRLRDTICNGDSVFFNNFWCRKDSVYTDTLVAYDGMDSLVVLFLKVNPTYRDTIYDSIFCTQYCIFGLDSLNLEGSYTHYLQTIHGCDSIVTLNLYVHTTRDLDSIVCMDRLPLVWNGITFPDTIVTAPIIYHDTAVVWNDTAQRNVLLAMHVTVVPNPIQTVADTIVENQLPYTFRGHVYTDNVESDTLLLPATTGCDTTTYYSLFYFPNVSATADSTICYGQLPFTWNGVTFTAPEGVTELTQTTTILAHTGADSILTMHVHILQNSYTTRHDTVVENMLPYEVHGHIYFDACYLDTLVIPNAASCDSVIFFRLLVNRNGVTMLDTFLCDYLLPINWNGQNFDDNGTTDLLCDTTIYQNSFGADSMVIMRVHILRCSSHTYDSTVCSAQLPLRWNGHVFNVPQDMPTILIDTLHLYTATGADSLVIMRLHVNETFNQTLYDTVCSNQPYTFLGEQYATSCTLNASLQTRAGCDSNVVVHLKVWSMETSMFEDIICPGTTYSWIDGHTYTEPILGPFSTLRTVHGCDSVVYLNLVEGEAAQAYIWADKTWIDVNDTRVRLVDDTPHGESREWHFPNGTQTEKLVYYTYPIEDDSVRIYLTATNRDGCVDSTSILLRLDKNLILVPNAFTPDLDENNHFSIAGEGLLNVEVTIYTRAGQFVYSWQGIDGYWDGTFNGEICPQAAYTYKITYSTERHPRDPQTKVGTVLLIR